MATDTGVGMVWPQAALAGVGAFSAVVNLLMLTGPLYMMQVYDRVLAARSVETLVALSGLVIGLFAMMGLLDAVRGRIMIRLGAGMQDRMDPQVFRRALARLGRRPDDAAALEAPKDLEAVQRAFASPAALSLFDLPFTPLFLGLIFLVHPALGALAVGGGAVLVALTVLNRAVSVRPLADAARHSGGAERMQQVLLAESESIRALGMADAAFRRWHALRHAGLVGAATAAERTGAIGVLTRVLRLALQSAMLGLGAWLVLGGQIGAGVMIACSILMGRALAPVEGVIAHWPVLMRGMQGRARLSALMRAGPERVPPLALPRPVARVQVDGLTLVPPQGGQPVLRGVDLVIAPGQAVGVIGPSGAGKSSLARAVAGVWAPQAGQVRLGGATLDQYDSDTLGAWMGYLPQRVTLFDGTVADNIARLNAPDPLAVVEAARRAAAHDMILALPQGYETPLTALGAQLSGGQVQRIGLARALYGDPVLLVLDEPDASLDADGTEALRAAVRDHKARGGAALIVAHRPTAIQDCDRLLVLENGLRRAFGPREEILRQMVRNHTEALRDRGAA